MEGKTAITFHPMGTNRMEAFSDGVMAIIITIMVLELKVPHGTELADLHPLVPKLLSYVLSFVYVGIYWNNHHHMLHTTERVNGAGVDCVGFGIIDPGRLIPAVGSCGMFTVEAYRNQGIGPAIITHLMDRCAERGLRPVAGCWYYNHRSKKTLEKAGLFTQTRLLKISY